MSITEDWQMAYAGLLVGSSTDFGVIEIKGLLDLPSVRSGDQTLLRQHGLKAGDDFLGSRVVAVTMDIYGANKADMQLRTDEFLTAFTVGDEQALTFQLPGVAGGGVGRIMARVRKRSVRHDLDFLNGLTRATVQLEATDPRIYIEGQSSGTAELPLVSGGATFDATFDLAFGTAGTSGSFIAVNEGTFAAPVLLKIEGPATDPSIENLSTGETLSLTGTIAAGSCYLINTADRTVMLNGTASRYSELDASSVWLQLAPGDNDLKFRADAYHADALLTATWRSAYV